MTEDDAKTKWCPMAKHPLGRATDLTRCIASDCMMWRPDWNQEGLALNPLSEDHPDFIEGVNDCEVAEYPTEGYCGLGGKP